MEAPPVLPGSLNVRAQLEAKNLFLTGTTGFVGKVLLEKIIRDVPGTPPFSLLFLFFSSLSLVSFSSLLFSLSVWLGRSISPFH